MFSHLNKTNVKVLSYVGAAICEGQPLEGVKKGPQILRQSGLFDTLKNVYGLEKLKDHGDISFDTLPPAQQRRKPIEHMVQNLHKVDPVLGALNRKLKHVFDEREDNEMVVTVGGDHSIGSATISAALSKYPDLKVIWVDAHADFVNPYLKGTPKQNYHGMPLSHVSGVMSLPGFNWLQEQLPFENIVLIGIRDVDFDEYVSLKKYNIKCFTIDHIQKYGMGAVMTEAIQYLDRRGDAPFHISYDVDGVDPSIVTQTGTMFRDGLTHRQACHVIKRVVNQRQLVSLDVVEINPDLGGDDAPRVQYRDEQYLKEDVTSTVGMGIDLITSLLSQTLVL